MAICDNSAIKEIFRYSHGIPRLINVVCDKALLTGFSRERNRIGKNIIRSVIKDIEIKEKSSWTLEGKPFLQAVIILLLLVLVSCGLLYLF